MVYKDLKTKELYASIPNADFVKVMFREGLRMGSSQLAVSAMEELILRGDTDYVYDGLNFGFKNGFVKPGTSMCSMIARSLVEGCREADPILVRYGKTLFKGQGGNGPSEWVKNANPNNNGLKYLSDTQGIAKAAEESIDRIRKMSVEELTQGVTLTPMEHSAEMNELPTT